MKKYFVFLILFLIPNISFGFEKTTNFDLKKLFEIQKSGKTIVINSWNEYCSTCAAQTKVFDQAMKDFKDCLLYTSPSPRDRTRSRMPSSA